METAPQPAGHIVWAMDRVAAWVDRGSKPDDPDSVPANTLKAMADDGMVSFDSDLRYGLNLVLTPLGRYEARRLAAWHLRSE